jgi:magnesium transporter
MAGGHGGVREETSGPGVFYLDTAGGFHQGLDAEALASAVNSGEGVLWVDINSSDDEQYRLLNDLFHFHPLAVEDVRSPNCRVKLEEYEGNLFVVVRGVRFAMETPEPYDLDTQNLYLFIGPTFLVTAHAGPCHPVGEVQARLTPAPDQLGRGVDRLAYQVLDALVDHYFPLLDQLDEFVDDLEDGIFRGGDGVLLEQIFELKRSLLVLRRHLAPMREVAATLANRPSGYLRPETQIYLRDVYDHVVRQLESVENYREMVSGALETNLMVISNRVNEVMKALSLIATVVLPPTLVASIYGMNFEHIPGAGSPMGFWIAIVAMVAIALGFLAYVWRKRWL